MSKCACKIVSNIDYSIWGKFVKIIIILIKKIDAQSSSSGLIAGIVLSIIFYI